MSSLSASAPTAFGWCARCRTEHRLQQGGARAHALTLQEDLRAQRRIDFLAPAAQADPRLATDYLFGPALGQMFGVLECEDSQGRRIVLRAFSCQYNGIWEVAGWIPPVFDVATYDRTVAPGDRRIKDLGLRIADPDLGRDERAGLVADRKRTSRALMKQLHALSTLQNFRGERAPLAAFFGDTNGVPAGAGNCCAPKLLHHAAVNNLRPLGLAEFYWGATNRSGTRASGRFYASCAAKCQPIMGFMLCGVES